MKCINCKKRDATENVLGSCCSSECFNEFVLKTPAKIHDLTDSATLDLIVAYMKNHKIYGDVLYSLVGQPNTTFIFDPIENATITELFLKYGEEFTALIRAGIKYIITSWHDEKAANYVLNKLTVQIGQAKKIKMNEWNPEYEGIPVEVNCQVLGANKTETYTKKAEAHCTRCGRSEPTDALSRLPICPNKDCANYRKSMVINQKSVETGYSRMILIQEPIEEAKHGTPVTFDCLIKDKDVETTYIGQRKKIIGVFRSYGQYKKETNRIVINAISVQDLDDVEIQQPSDEDISYFEKLQQKENFVDVITNSLAPEIKHESLAKLSVLLSIIGGNPSGRLRGDIHAMLCGSPSTGKSTILEFIPFIVQKSGFANGSTMSGSGVTVTMDTLPNRQKMPRAGIIPLCTGGVVAIDEMNQLEEEDIAKMFEAMESGWIHYNKGGFDIKLEAKTTIIAGANPKNYEYDYNNTMLENLGFMPPPMVSRFDLLINIASEKTDEIDDEINQHIIEIRKIGVEKYIENNKLLTPKQLLLFLNYVKTFKPTISAEAATLLQDFQKSMKKTAVKNPGMKRVDRRFFESMIRISIAWAKLNMSRTVTQEHAMTAIEIYKKALNTFGIDTDKGASVPKQETLIHGKTSAFETACRRLSALDKDGRFDESDLIKFILEKYPDYFTSEHEVQKMFDDFYKRGKLGKKGGRFRLE